MLLQDIRGVGKRNEAKEVSDGYARNFLLPRKLAERATPEALSRVEGLAARRLHERETHRAAAEAEAARVNALSLQFHAAANEGGELFGSVTPADIARALKEQGISHVEKIQTAPLKKLGTHAVEIDFGEGIKKTVAVTVLPATR